MSIVHLSELILLSYAFSHLLHYFFFSNSFFSLTLVFHPFLRPVLQPLSSFLTHHFGFPHASLPHLYLHQSLITSLVIHSPLSFSHHVFFFSFVWYSNIIYDYTSSEYSCVFGYISLFCYAYLCVFYLYQCTYFGTSLCIPALRGTNLE